MPGFLLVVADLIYQNSGPAIATVEQKANLIGLLFLAVNSRKTNIILKSTIVFPAK